jgi:(p)ppGpp synthase/HD superfamily hydrolase
MPDRPDVEVLPLLEAVAFAARAHSRQMRKDDKTPYASHVFRVCLILRHVFGVDDPKVLQASVLHDTVEDTTTDYDDLRERFGPEVAGWVALLSKDKRLPEEQREAAYMAGLATATWEVKACKLADIYDNLLDSAHLTPQQRTKTARRSREYLAALDDTGMPDIVRRAWNRVKDLLLENAE